MPSRPGAKVHDDPRADRHEFTEHKAQESRKQFLINLQPAQPYNDNLRQPPQERGEPDMVHRVTAAHNVPQRVERPPQEHPPHNEKEYRGASARDHRHGVLNACFHRVVYVIRGPSGDVLVRQPFREPVRKVNAPVFIHEREYSHV